MKNLINWFLNPPVDGPRATILLRLMAGGVFLSEGTLKFVYPNQGVGRLTKLGFPAPHFTATADGWLLSRIALFAILRDAKGREHFEGCD